MNLPSDIQANVSDDKQKARHETLRHEFTAGRTEKVITLANEALAHVYDDSEALFWKAAALLQQKKYKEAITYAGEATVENPFNARYFVLLSLLYLKNRESESAVLIADKGLALNPNELACLEIKAVALVSLFRLQEAHSLIQRILRLKAEGAVHQQPVFTADVDPELFYEQALTIDPFKTKSRLENFNTLKGQHATYRILRKITLVDRSKALTGFIILGSLITAVTYFFRKDATYQSFSPLLFILIWRGMASEKSINAATNFKGFFRGDFTRMLQHCDASITIKGVICYVLAFTGFSLWHFMQSWIGLVVAIISAALLSTLDDDFAPGNKLQSVPLRVSKRSRMVIKQMEELPYDDIYRLTMRDLPKKILSSGITARLFKYGLLIMLAWPVLFMIIRLFTEILPYSVLLYSEMALVICMAVSVSLYRIASLRYFFPADARHFVPMAHVKTARIVFFLWLVLAGSIVLHFTMDNPFILFATGALSVVIFIASLRRNASASENADQKAQLLTYVKQQYSMQQRHQ